MCSARPSRSTNPTAAASGGEYSGAGDGGRGASVITGAVRYVGRGLDDLAFDDVVDRRRIADERADDGVGEVEPRVVHEVDEDLAVAGVGAARRDSHGAAHVAERRELVAREGGRAGVLVRGGAPALHHEARLHAMERPPVPLARPHLRHEPRHGRRRLLGVQPQRQRPPAAAGAA